MNNEKNQFRILIIESPVKSVNEAALRRLKSILDAKFKSWYKSVRDSHVIGTAYYSLLPQLIVLDSDFKELEEKINDNPGLFGKIFTVPVIVMESDDNTRENFLGSPMNIIDFIPPDAGEEKITAKIEHAAEKSGFTVKSGKITERLVKRMLAVKIAVEGFDTILEGETTGLNRNGLGARTSAYNRSISELRMLAGKTCKVYFLDTDLGFMPVEGKVLKVAEGRGLRHKAFITVGFSSAQGLGLSSTEVELLEELIRKQEDDSIKKTERN